MNLPDGRRLVVHDVILPELKGGRLVLWWRGDCRDGFQEWERIGTAVNESVEIEQGLCSIAATSVKARQRLRGAIGRVVCRLIGARSETDWSLPNGEFATPAGGRRTDLRLAWAAAESTPLVKNLITARWPEARGIRSLGPDLYLVSGMEPDRSPREATFAEEPSQESELAITERALSAAIRSGDHRRIIMASSDLGLVLLHIGDTQRSMKTLSEALLEADRIGDLALHADVASNLAHTELYLGRPKAALDRLGPIVEYARSIGDVPAEKLALDRMARALLELGDREGGLNCLRDASILAARVGDRRHAADLLWLAAIHLADAGRRDEAVAAAGTAVDRLRQLHHPAAEWYAQHLENYRSGSARIAANPSGQGWSSQGGRVDVSAGGLHPELSASPDRVAAAGPLRMAITAAKSMATFMALGFKTTSPQHYRDRLAICTTCVHHTGTRCRVCGCITAAKARLQHERCPLTKWQ
ncbi:hypothetical protein SAMN05444166_0119 [Singulisphaera sp. GP187]|uniref:hypothetical protein n=1 Tax=Singulisphaera sp. GP187 TaxID=1882752 RepID=UPI000925BBC6|nr:hypothetical protein [Singulisphaera sp. GP187]SIN68742.1 hypothetical protein SAMN05444166_0119 [Singulisphaera sp. GP187]